MDGSPSEAMNIITGENINKNSIILEALPSHLKVENSDPPTCDMDLKEDKKTCPRRDFIKEHILPEREKLWGPYFEMRKALLAGITMEHDIKKLEKVNRGLLVEKETLCSAASKDAFNLEGLNESLPSTSEKKPSKSEFIRKFRRNLESTPYLKRQNFGRFDGIRCSLSSYSSELGRLLDANLSTKLEPSPIACGLLEENDTKNAQDSFLQHLLRRSHQSPWAMLQSEIAGDEQKKTSEDGEKAVQNSDSQGVHQNLNLPKISSFTMPCSAITEISPSDKLNEKSADIVNNLHFVEFPNILLPSWDSEKNWITDFQMRDSLNSPTKITTNKLLSINEMMIQRKYDQFWKWREERKLQTLNSRRGVLSGDIDGSECENTSSKEIRKTSRVSLKDIRRVATKFHNITSTENEMDFLNQLQLFKHMKRVRTKTSYESTSYVRSHFSLSNTYPDKVVAD